MKVSTTTPVPLPAAIAFECLRVAAHDESWQGSGTLGSAPTVSEEEGRRRLSFIVTNPASPATLEFRVEPTGEGTCVVQAAAVLDGDPGDHTLRLVDRKRRIAADLVELVRGAMRMGDVELAPLPVETRATGVAPAFVRADEPTFEPDAGAVVPKWVAQGTTAAWLRHELRWWLISGPLVSLAFLVYVLATGYRDVSATPVGICLAGLVLAPAPSIVRLRIANRVAPRRGLALVAISFGWMFSAILIAKVVGVFG